MIFRTISMAGLCFAAGLGSFAASPATAQDAEVLTPSSNWKLGRWPDRCSLSRSFSDGEEETRLVIEKGGNEPSFNLMLIGERTEHVVGNIISLRFGPDEEAFGRQFLVSTTSRGEEAIVMFGASLAMPKPNDGDDGYTIDKVEGERLAAIEYLEVERAGLRPFRLALGSLVVGWNAMEDCTQKLEGRLAVSDTGESRAPEPEGNPGLWVVSGDYPRIALNQSHEGIVTVRLTVDAEGKPVYCVVQNSSTPQLFDDAVCGALLRRAQFSPALDWEGNPRPSYYTQSVRFSVRR